MARPSSVDRNAGVYFVIDNPTRQADTLLTALSNVADAVEVHLSRMDESAVMKMQLQKTTAVPARSQDEFRPGGLHLMLINLKSDLKVGDTSQVPLVFRNAGEVSLDVSVGES